MRSYSASLGCVAVALLLASCSSVPPAYRGTQPETEVAPPLGYSITFLIHGDGDYLYHDPRGQAHRADEEAVAAALRVAQHNPHAEVFVFHERPRRRAMLRFPRRDGEFYYYRHGRLIARELYWRDQGASRSDPGYELYRRFRTPEQGQLVRLFLYFGHAIPEVGGRGYDRSYPERSFSVRDLADGLKRITHGHTKLDLVVLSTCFSGTPYTISALAPYAKIIVASPGNLHLSYMDVHPFEQLEVGLADGDVAAFSRRFARTAFDRLTEDVQTAVAVAVYDVERVRVYMDSVAGAYEQVLATLQRQGVASGEHVDCASEPRCSRPGMSVGVDVLYRPARFGRLQAKVNHSGWECWKDPDPEGPAHVGRNNRVR